jgi:beta-galactosidase/beta-glucuronidase
MHRLVIVSFATLIALAAQSFMSSANAAWPPTPAKLMTRWASDVTILSPLPEYPRPQMVRADWESLNGMWDYAVTPAGLTAPPKRFDGNILVPYPFQSALSGVMKPLDPTKRLWYHRNVKVLPKWATQKLLLHFGAVSWQADIFVNGQQIATHRGDYDAFTIDVTDVAKGVDFDLAVQVYDPIQTGGQPRGKQVSASTGVYYTASSGIWRTVWLEPVGPASIDHLWMQPDVDNSALKFTAIGYGTDPFDRIEAIASVGGKEVGRVEGPIGNELTLPIPTPHLWDFTDPFLYDLKVTLFHGVGKADEVKSYFGMRKVSLGKDDKGILRPMLNNKFVFQIGVLDQGFWPDGLYTAPTDEAVKYDILMTKKFGFNVSRKHVKVEPDRWYYW